MAVFGLAVLAQSFHLAFVIVKYLGAVTLLAWVVAVAQARRLLRSPRALRLANRLSATTMAGAAAAIAAR